MRCHRCKGKVFGPYGYCPPCGHDEADYSPPAPQPERRYRCRLCPMALDNSGAFASHVRSHAAIGKQVEMELV